MSLPRSGGDAKTWQGPEDGSFRFAVEHDADYLYLAIETTDERLVLDPGRTPWDQDGIEVRMDVRSDPERSNSRGWGEFSETLLLALSPGETREEMVYFNRESVPEGVRAVCVTTKGEHATEIAIPVAYLNANQGTPWSAVRLNIAVDDHDDPAGPLAQIWWRPDWRYPLSYPGSGTFARR